MQRAVLQAGPRLRREAIRILERNVMAARADRLPRPVREAFSKNAYLAGSKAYGDMGELGRLDKVRSGLFMVGGGQ